VQELIASMMRFSAAMTLFGMQQFQNAVGAAADTQSAMNKFKEALDAMSNAVAAQMDDSKKATLDSMSKVQNDLVDRSFDAMNVQAWDPREVMQTTGDLMKKTSDSLAELVKKAAPAKGASEPKPAAEALSH
jgi:ABC-type transporter Mla subunit MlaD